MVGTTELSESGPAERPAEVNHVEPRREITVFVAGVLRICIWLFAKIGFERKGAIAACRVGFSGPSTNRRRREAIY